MTLEEFLIDCQRIVNGPLSMRQRLAIEHQWAQKALRAMGCQYASLTTELAARDFQIASSIQEYSELAFLFGVSLSRPV